MKTDLRKTKIVCTIGPASENRLEELIDAGMNVVRINFSHGSYEEQREKTERFLELRERLGKPVALLLDMQGPEVRTGMLVTGKNEKVELVDGQEFVLVNEDIIGDNTRVSVTYKDLYKDVTPGTKILIDDGSIELTVQEIIDKDIKCIVSHGNKLGSRKTINVPGVALKLPALKEKDIQDLKDGARVGFDYVAGSFVRNADDVRQIRQVLDENGGKDIKIICKIENQEGVDNIDEILDLADGIMVARGDMAVEVPFEDVPVVQKHFIKTCNRNYKPVITATQMLESMTQNPLPTRAEVSDVANAVFDRTSAIMLSGECAMGKFPVKCVETMVKISKKAESNINYWNRFEKRANPATPDDMEVNIAYSVCKSARTMNADAIVAYTNTGDSVRKLAGMGPQCPILAVTDNKKTFNQLALVFNVHPVYVETKENIDSIIEAGIEKHKELGHLESGDIVVLSGGSNILPHYTNSKIFGGFLKV